MHIFVRLALAAVLSVAMAGAAFALETCSGEFSASPLRAMPVPSVVGIDVTDNSPENAGLASAFTRGMSDAGARVPGSDAATVKLRLSWQVLSPGGGGGGAGGGGGGGGQGATGGSPQSFLQGGIDRVSPALPDNNVFTGPRGPLQPGLLVFRAEARDPAGSTIYWIGSVQCTLRGGDDEKLLYQLGQLIGGSIGQRRDRVAM